MACDNVSQETHKANTLAHGQHSGEGQSRQTSHKALPQFVGCRNNSCEPSGLLIVDEDVKLSISKQRLKTVTLASYAKLTFNPAFL